MPRTKMCPECFGVMVEQKPDMLQMVGDFICRDCSHWEKGV
ncbi:hypothetical protein [Arenivirga flava]|uniref:Uncharacterized protein n=1 Tax=Arenivirga flava TaxID=1930060 RepID=A0AA37UK58_9MICO|nr:hypothetical protein [Arenivirga flava]GMA28205.1 hypothetical protein GCM10025874_14580 [Arenivirga flava]